MNTVPQWRKKKIYLLYTQCMSACRPEKSTKSRYRWLWATMWLLGIELGAFGRAVSALNRWAISPDLRRFSFYPSQDSPVFLPAFLPSLSSTITIPVSFLMLYNSHTSSCLQTHMYTFPAQVCIWGRTYFFFFPEFGLLCLILHFPVLSVFPSNFTVSLSFRANVHSILFEHHVFIIHSPAGCHLGWHHLLAAVNRAA